MALECWLQAERKENERDLCNILHLKALSEEYKVLILEAFERVISRDFTVDVVSPWKKRLQPVLPEWMQNGKRVSTFERRVILRVKRKEEVEEFLWRCPKSEDLLFSGLPGA